MASLLEERGEELRSLHSDLQQKNSDITGQCDTIGAFWSFNGNVHLQTLAWFLQVFVVNYELRRRN